ncbi:hypothetical protein ACM26V_02430 [Salipaludibacillus sp. HK11]|uniref:hypothetical protein n=1 Tax=Salipaludibacillus sp. HK11 TaxID=3394320 RepID=UPI0039FBF102
MSISNDQSKFEVQSKTREIIEEMNQTKLLLVYLKKNLNEIQENCNHEFIEGPLYKQCSICLKMEAIHF